MLIIIELSPAAQQSIADGKVTLFRMMNTVGKA